VSDAAAVQPRSCDVRWILLPGWSYQPYSVAWLLGISLDESFYLLVIDRMLTCPSPLQLMGVEAFLAHHHAGDVGPPPAWGGIADDGPDAVSLVLVSSANSLSSHVGSFNLWTVFSVCLVWTLLQLCSFM
jgi:hypothetical protein